MRSDVFSLGMVLYEMLTGRLPYEGRDLDQRIQAQSESAPTSPKIYCTVMSERLEMVVLRCLENRAGQRFQQADDLLASLADSEESSRDLNQSAELANRRPLAHCWTDLQSRIMARYPEEPWGTSTSTFLDFDRKICRFRVFLLVRGLDSRVVGASLAPSPGGPEIGLVRHWIRERGVFWFPM